MGSGDSSGRKVDSSRSESMSADSKRGAPGEFTRMFQAPVPPCSDERSDAAAEERKGENIFADMLPDLPQDQRPASSPVPLVRETASVRAGAEGEFTRFFQTPIPVSPLPVQATLRSSAQQESDDTDEWLRLLETEREPMVDRCPVVPPAPTFPALENLPEAPSEFTLITAGQPKRSPEKPPVVTPPPPQVIPATVSAVSITPPVPYAAIPNPLAVPVAVQPVTVPVSSVPQLQPPAPHPEREESAERPKVSYLPLIIVFNVLFVLAVLLILYFALRH